MADNELRAHDETLDGQSSPPPKGAAGKIKAAAFIAVVIGVECAIAYFFVPSASETAAIAGATLGIDPETGEIAPQETGDSSTEASDQLEVPLGQFSVTAFQPVSNSTLRIDFELYGTIDAKDEIEFFQRMEENRHRFREQVIVTIRTADITDFTEAQLGLVRRRVLERSNRVLGKPLLRGVIFSEFSFIEQ